MSVTESGWQREGTGLTQTRTMEEGITNGWEQGVGGDVPVLSNAVRAKAAWRTDDELERVMQKYTFNWSSIPPFCRVMCARGSLSVSTALNQVMSRVTKIDMASGTSAVRGQCPLEPPAVATTTTTIRYKRTADVSASKLQLPNLAYSPSHHYSTP